MQAKKRISVISLFIILESSPLARQRYLVIKKREPNYHTPLDGRRKPEDKDVEKAAHAYDVRTACLLASSKISYVF